MNGRDYNILIESGRKGDYSVIKKKRYWQVKSEQKESSKGEIQEIIVKTSSPREKCQENFWEELRLFKEAQKLWDEDIFDIESQYSFILSQSLISLLPYEIIMSAIRELELKVEKRFSELTDKMDDFVKEKGKNYESCVVYFKKLDETERAFNYLQDRRINFQPIGSGTILTNQRVVKILNEGKFKFGIVKDTKELYEKEPNLIKDYAKQIRKHYNLPSWTSH